MYHRIKITIESEEPGRVKRSGAIYVDMDELSKHAGDYEEFKKTMNELEENIIETIKGFMVKELIYFLIESERERSE